MEQIPNPEDRPDATGRPTPATTGAAPRGHADDVVASHPPRGRRVLAAAALATGLVIGGAAVAAAVSGPGQTAAVQAGSLGAADSGPQGSASSAPGSESTRPDGGPAGRGARGTAGTRGALHGELTVPQTDGTGTRVVLLQRGKVTAVSSSEIALTSSDGFTATYPVTSSTRVRTATGTTIAGVEVGDTVDVVAAKGGAALRVSTGGMRGMGRHHGWAGGENAPGAPAPGTTPTRPGTTPSAPPTGTSTGSATGTSFDVPVAQL